HPETRSGWLRRDLIERVTQATRRPVEHVVVDDPEDSERGKETLVVANQTVEDRQLLDLMKSRSSDGRHRFVLILPQGAGGAVDPQTLGMYLFIISEIMLFGAFFTAYFFIRVVQADPWPPPQEEIPVLVAGVNTAILISSSFTMHWALEGIKNNNRRAMRAGLI